TELDDWAAAGEARAKLARRDAAISEMRRKDNLFRLVAGGGIDVSTSQIEALKREAPDPVRGYFLTEESPTSPVTHILLRGSADRPGAKVNPGLPAVLAERQPEFLTPSTFTTRRRLSLANWITDPHNPLTARVIVNRIWQWHFGDGLVRTESDFGVMGQKPTHPELLDWLADWFVQEGWSIKKLNRLILQSHVYRQSAAIPRSGDPENRLWGRVPYRRLEVEAFRAAVLAVSGRLSRDMGGPGVFLPIPKEALEGHSDPKTVWTPSDERSASRRTVYAVVKRSLTNPLLETLDLCDTARSTAKRTTTTVAPQALTLFNGEFVNQQAKYLADRLEREAGADEAKQIDLAYRLALCPPPADRGVEVMRAVLRKSGGGRGAREQLGRVLFNLNEFVYPD